ncbi:M43 family zinc metalloprotease [Rapidithrix thailandica]|uniref:M43 family zinc metalloprotease n=1 Tax=Rapidithrix thailandica TaxID=413964 RepID=A0AAW9SEA5_9BACT
MNNECCTLQQRLTVSYFLYSYTQTYCLLLTLFFCFSFLITHAQEGVKCGTDQVMQELYRQHPAAKEKAKQFEQFSKKLIQSTFKQQTQEEAYIIPVVFHIFGTDQLGSTVDENTVKYALQKLNEDFKGLNNDWDQVSGLFEPVKATLNIEFKLASIDPQGNPTTGITLNPVLAGFGNGGGYDTKIQQYAWDNYKYMNVYIMLDLYNNGVTNNSGVAWYPDTYMSDNNLARVVYNGRYLGYNTNENFRRVLTHEFGHWLNLAHTFDNGCDAPGDHVDDTPATTANSGTCNTSTERCAGAGIPNGENFMDYSECYRMFTQGQVNRMKAALQHPTRQPLWQESNLIATGTLENLGPHLLYSNAKFEEADINDGSIGTTAQIVAKEEATFAVTGTLTEGTHYTTSNIPEGLQVKITVNSATTATVSFQGNATSHQLSNSIDNGIIAFQNAAITGGTSGLFNQGKQTIRLNFNNPYQIVYTDIDDITVNSNNTWEYFVLSGTDIDYGCWYDNGKLRLETYTKPMVCQNENRNISFLQFNDTISIESNWVEGASYPNEHNIRTDNYTTWDGNIGYMGFSFTNDKGKTLYGWFRISVNASGTEYTLHEYAFHQGPNFPILAGQREISEFGPALLYLTSKFEEDDINDGSINSTTSITAEGGAAFAVTGNLVEGTHFTTSNIPEGLQVQITVNTPNKATLSFQGQALSHNAASSVTNGTIEFLDAVIEGGQVSDLIRQGKQTIKLNFNNPYQIVYTDIEDITVNSTNTWKRFVVAGSNTAFGCWVDNGNLRFETYTKPMVCQSEDRNISLLQYNDTISDQNNWVDGGEYPDEHNIRTSDYTLWDGKTGYMGFHFTNEKGKSQYGWFRISVNASGTEYSLHDYAFHQGPGFPILAGQKEIDQSPEAPEAEFQANATTVSVGDTVYFTDLSSASPNSWAWSFSGGTPEQSAVQHPEVIYSVPGVYPVSLTVSNSQGTATKTKVDYITVNPLPDSSYCEVSNGAPNGQYIQSVSFANLQNANSGYEESGYSDFTHFSANLSPAASETLNITLHASWEGTALKAWIDWNGDGNFSNTEEVLSANGEGPTYTAQVTPPASAVNTTRMRIRTVYGNTPTPCGNEYFSEVEDYTINVKSVSYCNVSNGAPIGQYIQSVSLGNLQNANSGYEESGYSDFTHFTANLSPAASETLNITLHASWEGTALKAWIDWNGDGNFSNAEEVLSANGEGTTYTAQVTPPASSVNATRMRIRTVYGNTPAPCGNEYFSEVEDYTISISGNSGKIAHSGLSGFSEKASLQLLIYPNPSKGHISLNLEGLQNDDKILITILNTQGKQFLQKTLDTNETRKQLELDLSNYPKGMYLLKSEVQGQMTTKKFLIE